MVAFLRFTASRRDFLKYLGSAAATSAFACSSPGMAFAQQAAAPAYDIVFKGGTILTMNDKAPRAEAIALRGNNIGSRQAG
jgi:anaerobic selenocysteine-containing dehydrogenase